MFREICGILVLTFLIDGGQSDLPPGIVRCASLLDDGTCIEKQMQSIFEVLRNDPSLLNVKNIQPMIIEEWSVPPGNFLNFEQEYKNIKLYNHNFNNITYAATISSLESQFFLIPFENPEVMFVADYEFKNASFQEVSLTSRGKALFRHQGIQGTAFMSTLVVEINNKKHIKIIDMFVTCDPSKMVFELFTGEEEQSAKISDVLNDNWDLVVEDVGRGYYELYAEAYRQVMQAIYDKFPCEELFLDCV